MRSIKAAAVAGEVEMCNHKPDRAFRNKKQYVFNIVCSTFFLCLLYGISVAVDRSDVYCELCTGSIALDTFYIVGTTDHVDKIEINGDASVKKLTIMKTTQGEFCGEFSLDWHLDKKKVFSICLGRSRQLVYAVLDGERRSNGIEVFKDVIPKQVILQLNIFFSNKLN